MPGGVQKFYGSGYLSEDHEKYISPDFFELVGGCNRYPRYKNKRGIDPQVKIFLDQEGIIPEVGWNLPVPNQDAAYKSLAKYGKGYVNMPPEVIDDLNLAWSWMERQFHPYMRDSRVVTLDEAVQRLDMSSGSGCPFNEEFPKKKELFEKDENILQWLEDDWKVLATDPHWKTVFSSSLKEELRPEEKIAENSIRTFAAGAVDATVHGTRLFVDQNEKMYASYLKTASAIGMTPLKGNWERLYQKLSIFKNGYALDESQYDSSLREFLMWGCAKFRWNCLRSEDRTTANLNRIRTYYSNLVNTLMLTPEGILILKKTGNPSGSVNTVTDNTLILYWIMAFAWIQTAPEEEQTYTQFEMNTAKALLGDDNTWTVSDEAHYFYNGPTVIETWKQLGITTTTDCLTARLPEDLDFLSSHTVFLDGMAIPLYDRNKLMQAVLFAPQQHLTPETTLTRVTCLLQIGWSDPPFRKFCRSLIQFLLEEYDDVLKEDGRWIMAKCQIQTDEFYYKLFTGRTVTLYTQGYQETQERLNKPDKDPDMASLPVRKSVQSRNVRRTQRTRGPQKKAVAIAMQKMANQPRKRNPRRKVRGRGRARGPTTAGNERSFVLPIDEQIILVNGVTSATFSTGVTTLPLNPGNATTFPFLSRTAQNYDRYEFLNLNFHYKPSASVFATVGSQGFVGLSAVSDAKQSPPSSQAMAEILHHSPIVETAKATSLTLTKKFMESSSKQKHFVRPNGLIPGGSDPHLYDAGQLFFWATGQSATTQIGEVRVTGSVRLMNPVLETSTTAPTNFNASWFASTAAQTYVNTVATTALNATAVANNLTIVNTSGSMVPPIGNYQVDFTGRFTDTAAEAYEVFMDFKKNGTTIYPAANAFPAFNSTSLGAGEIVSLSGSVFVSANGTDAFTQTITMAGAAGTLAGLTSVRWIAL